ncbi:MAG TPA: hypothetical protein VFG32_03610 [Bacteroidota bacterium]|nr:hypothetical protein [Bacteroidota bacterium]
MKLAYTSEEVELWRDKIHRRNPRLAVKSKAQALRFIEDVGFCFAFKSENSESPCLWHAALGTRNPEMPKHTHHDPYLSFVWEMKNILPSERKIYYGKLLKHRPTMISMAYFPHFYALSERTGTPDEYLDEFSRGKLSPVAKAIMDSLADTSPQVTKGLKLATGNHTKGDRAVFDKAIAELQSKMFIVKVAEHHEPFTFEWAPVHSTFPAMVRKSRKISAPIARCAILERYFRNQLIGTVDAIHRLFGWKKQIVYQSLGKMVEEGIIIPNVRVDGKDSKYYCLVH